MSLRYGVLCLLLAFVVLLLSLKNYETWTRPVRFIPEKNITKKSGTKIEGSPLIAGQKEPTTIEAYILIGQKNIFNPERKDFPIPIIGSPTGGPGGGPMGEAAKKPPARPKIILYGVAIQGEYQVASLAYPGRPLQKGERETYTVKLGDRIGEYKLAKVSSDRISLEAEGDSFEVLLYDSTTPRIRTAIRTEIKPTPAGPVPGSIGAAPSPITAGPTQPVPLPQTPTPPTPPIPTQPRPIPRGRPISNQPGAPSTQEMQGN